MTSTHTPDARHYVRIWAVLCALLVVSVVGPMFGIRALTLMTAFGIAFVKAYLVATHFMHVHIEKRWVPYLLVGMIAFMIVMFAGIAPDVLRQRGHNWQKSYVEPTAEQGAGIHP